MFIDRLTRRAFLSGSGAAAVVAAGGSAFLSPGVRAELPMPKASGRLEEMLDDFIKAYMAAMNAPGLTLGLSDLRGTLRTAGYGYADVDKRLPVAPDLLFQIGSITKSFVGLVLLQLRDEGKLELDNPVLDYLADLPISCPFGVITIHHLLTHTSGLPDNLGIFAGDSARLVQGFKPGEHFHYCNAGFEILGYLATKLDVRTWRECVTARILAPLEMTATTGVITTSARSRSAVGYQPYWDDQVYPRQGRLAPAPNLVMDDTAGCIASTPGDMARYLRMLANGGNSAKGRIVSQEGFRLFSTAHVKAPVLSPTASYGYGIGVDTLDGHKILRHTGGMVAFASSIHVDLDAGVAAFASINAMQDYRPTAVTEYSVRLLRAQHDGKALPAAPPLADPRNVDNPADYTGTFTAPDGQTLTFSAIGQCVSLVANGKTVPLQHMGCDSFISTEEGEFSGALFEFARRPEDAGKGDRSTDQKKPKPPVTEVSYGGLWFANPAYTGPRAFHVPPEWSAFVGHYRSDSPWGGDIRVYVLKDRLMLGGKPLLPIGGAQFRAGDEEWTPDTAEFLNVFEGKARLLRLTGIEFARIDVD